MIAFLLKKIEWDGDFIGNMDERWLTYVVDLILFKIEIN